MVTNNALVVTVESGGASWLINTKQRKNLHRSKIVEMARSAINVCLTFHD